MPKIIEFVLGYCFAKPNTRHYWTDLINLKLKYCNKLIASVTADKFVNKGPNRPAFSIKERINFLKSITFIDEVLISNSETAIQSINKIKPDVYFKERIV